MQQTKGTAGFGRRARIRSSVAPGAVTPVAPHPPVAGQDPANLVTVCAIVPGDKAAGPVSDTGHHLVYPA